jgi:hypothetical protein
MLSNDSGDNDVSDDFEPVFSQVMFQLLMCAFVIKFEKQLLSSHQFHFNAGSGAAGIWYFCRIRNRISNSSHYNIVPVPVVIV